MEDSKLLRLLHKKPDAGMEQLMNQYACLVYSVVKGKFADFIYVSSDIEDCVADVFSEFYTNLSKYDPEISSIKSYLCVLARYHATDIIRKRERQRADISLDDEDCMLYFTDDSELDEDELRREVMMAVKSLGEPDSSIIIRKYYLGESSKEIAEILKLTVSNVDTRTHRALNKLKKKFGGSET